MFSNFLKVLRDKKLKQKCAFLPRRLTKEEVALAPMGWLKTISNYTSYRSKAIQETKPGYYTLLSIILAAIARHDGSVIDTATELTRENMPQHMFLTLVGAALCCFGSKEEGLSMLREAVKLNPSHSLLLVYASETDDIEEKENLSNKVLNENPEDNDALRHLAYTKSVQGKHGEAEILIDRILNNEPDNVFALEYKGNIYFEKKEYNKTLEYYLKINLKPTPISLNFKICRCYYLIGKLRKAKKIAKKIQPKLSLAYDLEIDIGNANKLLTEILNS